jgi:hypothetical protein
MSHCFACSPCCCRSCDPWSVFVRSWDGLSTAIGNPDAARWLLFMESTAGKWIVEAGELKGMGKSDIAALKSYLSRQRDLGEGVP